MTWPASIQAGTKSDACVGVTDFMATCAEITGFKLPNDAADQGLFQGRIYNIDNVRRNAAMKRCGIESPGSAWAKCFPPAQRFDNAIPPPPLSLPPGANPPNRVAEYLAPSGRP